MNSAFVIAGEILNAITDFVYSLTLTSQTRGIALNIPTLILIVLCIGWIIHSLANKEP